MRVKLLRNVIYVVIITYVHTAFWVWSHMVQRFSENNRAKGNLVNWEYFHNMIISELGCYGTARLC